MHLVQIRMYINISHDPAAVTDYSSDRRSPGPPDPSFLPCTDALRPSDNHMPFRWNRVSSAHSSHTWTVKVMNIVRLFLPDPEHLVCTALDGRLSAASAPETLSTDHNGLPHQIV